MIETMEDKLETGTTCVGVPRMGVNGMPAPLDSSRNRWEIRLKTLSPKPLNRWEIMLKMKWKPWFDLEAYTNHPLPLILNPPPA